PPNNAAAFARVGSRPPMRSLPHPRYRRELRQDAPRDDTGALIARLIFLEIQIEQLRDREFVAQGAVHVEYVLDVRLEYLLFGMSHRDRQLALCCLTESPALEPLEHRTSHATGSSRAWPAHPQ